MAQHLDLEEQEQLDQLKHVWKQYGGLLTGILFVIALAFAGWMGYRAWDQKRGLQASAMYDEVERAAQGGDLTRLEQSFNDIRTNYASTVPAQQAGLLAAKAFYDKGKPDAAKAALTWVADKSSDEGYKALAHLRLAGVLIQEKAYDEALKQLNVSMPKEFEALVSDRKGDVYALQGKKPEAIAAYTQAFKAFAEEAPYRSAVGYKLNALGVDPNPQVATTKVAGVAQ